MRVRSTEGNVTGNWDYNGNFAFLWAIIGWSHNAPELDLDDSLNMAVGFRPNFE